jgi:hypothetical protein
MRPAGPIFPGLTARTNHAVPTISHVDFKQARERNFLGCQGYTENLNFKDVAVVGLDGDFSYNAEFPNFKVPIPKLFSNSRSFVCCIAHAIDP